jgi:hypothetical protein
MKMPDVTLAQLLAAFTWVAGEIATMGIADQETTKVILTVGLTVIAAAWKVADAIIRNGRSRALEVPPRPPTAGNTL